MADQIAAGLREHLPTELVEVGEAPQEIAGEVTLVVLGGPTHALGMSRPATRTDAAQQAGQSVVSATIGQREWLQRATLPDRIATACFDTRSGRGRVPGSAARASARRLRRLGARQLAPPASFFVGGTQGPLLDGEGERARRWGDQLGGLVTEQAHPTVG